MKSWEKLRSHLDAAIVRGDFPVGTPLPKQEYFCFDWNLSIHTVRRAYGALLEDGRIHQVGKRFQVGPAPAKTFRRTRQVMLLTDKPETWGYLHNSNVEGRFCDRFEESLRLWGTHWQRMSLEPGRRRAPTAFPCSHAAIERWMMIAGSAYCGTLVVAKSEVLKRHRGFLHSLSVGARPVVWWDRGGEGLPSELRDFGWRRCHVEESEVCRIAVGHVADLGHRMAAFAFDPSVGWHVERLKLLQASSREAGVNLVPCPSLGDGWTAENPSSLERRIRSLQSLQRPGIDAAIAVFGANPRKAGTALAAYSAKHFAARVRGRTMARPEAHLLWNTLQLLPALVRPDVRCLLAGNDGAALPYMEFLEDAGYRLPEEFSVLGFDNRRPVRAYDITSVDKGLGGLGQLAAEATTDIFRGPGARKGDIVSKPFMADKGSVADLSSSSKWAD